MEIFTGKKRIGILTFHWADDFGAMLQAYGLKNTIDSMGFEADIIPYSNRNLSGRYRLFRWVGVRSDKKETVGYWDKSVIKKNIKGFPAFFKKRYAMKSFRRQYLTRKISKSSELFLKTNKYDAFVIGSDQVWNPEITVGIDNMYFGEFSANGNAKKIAYAASIGKECLQDADGEIIGKLIDRNFEAVSVRESSSIPFLNRFCKKEICDMPDPTLLCEQSIWGSMVRDPGIREQYGLVYSTEWNEEMRRFAGELCDKDGLKLIDARQLAVGPAEFLWLVKNARYVITNSFHCTVFSIIFHKCFFVFNHSNKNARLVDLLKNTGLENRIADHFSLECDLQRMDWKSVDECLSKLRNKGKEYLRENL